MGGVVLEVVVDTRWRIFTVVVGTLEVVAKDVVTVVTWEVGVDGRLAPGGELEEEPQAAADKRPPTAAARATLRDRGSTAKPYVGRRIRSRMRRLRDPGEQLRQHPCRRAPYQVLTQQLSI